MVQRDPRPVFESPESSEKLLVDFTTRCAYKLLRQFKEKFIQHHIRRWFRGHYKQPGGIKETDLFHNYEWILNNVGTTRVLDEMPHLDTFANDMLLMKNSLREYKRSPLNFWLSAIGGHIPLFSNIITIVRTVGGLYSKWSERKNNWILLVQSNPRQ